MAHQAQQQFFEKVKTLHPKYFTDSKILECGSLNVNGSFRPMFTNCEYLGIDIVPGTDVDMVVKTHEMKGRKSTYDAVVTGEMLEHDEYWKESLHKMYDLTKHGGLIAITCAGKGRPEHGTTATGAHWGTSNDYYRNITPEDIKTVYSEDMFTDWYFEENEQAHDTYFYGIKK